MEYRDFHGEIPAGEYGGGRMTIFDRGTYETEKWRDGEVIFTLHGERVSGRYVLFRTDGKNWMIHRMDPPLAGFSPMPDLVAPMLPVRAAKLPADDDAWAYELAWEGVRAVTYVSGGRPRVLGGDEKDITASYPEVREMAEALAPTECVLDGMIVAFDAGGRVSEAALRPRVRVTDSAAARRAASRVPVQYLVFDLLWVEGRATVDLPYTERRELLDALDLAGPHWVVPPHFTGGGEFARQASREQGTGGVVAKRLDSPYLPGKRTRQWLEIP